MFQLIAMNICRNESLHELFLEVGLNHESLKLYTFWVHWKKQCRTTISKHLCYGASLNINILLTYLLKISLTHFMELVFSFYTPWNTSEKLLSGGIERNQCHEMSQELFKYSVTYFVTDILLLKSFLQNETVSFPQLMVMKNLSPVTYILFFSYNCFNSFWQF